MRSTQKKHTKCSGNYWKNKGWLVIISLFFFQIAQAQNNQWKDIELIDTLSYTAFSHQKTDNSHYPPSHLFDGQFNTCWVANKEKTMEHPQLYLRLPDNPRVMNIYPGYGKSLSLFYKNARPVKLKLSLYAGINPEGYVSEHAMIYKATKYPVEQEVHLKDSAMVQHIPLEFPDEEIQSFQYEAAARFKDQMNMSPADTCLILQIEILDVKHGSEYKDICISEIFFSNRLVTDHSNENDIDKVYLNEEENTLMIQTDDQEEITVYEDKQSVLQLVDISKNRKWAILISMPAEIQGRAETTYLLADLVNKKIVNQVIEKSTGRFIAGTELFFDYDSCGNLYLNYYDQDYNERKVELK